MRPMMIGRLVTQFAAGLRYPTLFKVVAALFVLDFLVPLACVAALLALGTLLLGTLKSRRAAVSGSQ